MSQIDNLEPMGTKQAGNQRLQQATAVGVIPLLQQALEVLGDQVPPELAEAARLRIDYPEASLPELGKMLQPHLSRHGVRKRLYRLLDLADQITTEQKGSDHDRTPGS